MQGLPEGHDVATLAPACRVSLGGGLVILCLEDRLGVWIRDMETTCTGPGSKYFKPLRGAVPSIHLCHCRAKAVWIDRKSMGDFTC